MGNVWARWLHGRTSGFLSRGPGFESTSFRFGGGGGRGGGAEEEERLDGAHWNPTRNSHLILLLGSTPDSIDDRSKLQQRFVNLTCDRIRSAEDSMTFPDKSSTYHTTAPPNDDFGFRVSISMLVGVEQEQQIWIGNILVFFFTNTTCRTAYITNVNKVEKYIWIKLATSQLIQVYHIMSTTDAYCGHFGNNMWLPYS